MLCNKIGGSRVGFVPVGADFVTLWYDARRGDFLRHYEVKFTVAENDSACVCLLSVFVVVVLLCESVLGTFITVCERRRTGCAAFFVADNAHLRHALCVDVASKRG